MLCYKRSENDSFQQFNFDIYIVDSALFTLAYLTLVITLFIMRKMAINTFDKVKSALNFEKLMAWKYNVKRLNYLFIWFAIKFVCSGVYYVLAWTDSLDSWTINDRNALLCIFFVLCFFLLLFFGFRIAKLRKKKKSAHTPLCVRVFCMGCIFFLLVRGSDSLYVSCWKVYRRDL